MRDRLPPLFSLQAFEAAARLGGFSGAAAELNLTPGAVSRQIRQLEDWCALVLFERHGPRIALTREGSDLLARLDGPLSALHEAVYPVSPDALQVLQVATLASIAKSWLLPRLGSFREAYPDIALTVHTDYGLVRPAPRIAMIAIRHGPLPGAELHGEVLFEDRLVALAAPAYAEVAGPDPAAWSPHSVLQHLAADTDGWFDSAGAPGFAARGPAFNDADVLLEAAQQGLGIAVSRLSIALPRIKSGKLVAASPLHCRSPRDNILVVRRDCLDVPAVRCFIDWVRSRGIEFGRSMASLQDGDLFRPAA